MNQRLPRAEVWYKDTAELIVDGFLLCCRLHRLRSWSGPAVDGGDNQDDLCTGNPLVCNGTNAHVPQSAWAFKIKCREVSQTPQNKTICARGPAIVCSRLQSQGTPYASSCMIFGSSAFWRCSGPQALVGRMLLAVHCRVPTTYCTIT